VRTENVTALRRGILPDDGGKDGLAADILINLHPRFEFFARLSFNIYKTVFLKKLANRINTFPLGFSPV